MKASRLLLIALLFVLGALLRAPRADAPPSSQTLPHYASQPKIGKATSPLNAPALFSSSHPQKPILSRSLRRARYPLALLTPLSSLRIAGHSSARLLPVAYLPPVTDTSLPNAASRAPPAFS